jgi:TRAP-type C4-dicarboxylate transport system permease large subunit
MDSLKPLWAVIALFLLVMGGIYAGLMFPSAAGAVGAIGALLIGVARRKLGTGEIADALRQTAISTAVLFLIIVAGLLFSRSLLVTGFITGLTAQIRELSIQPWVFIGLVIVLYLILGMFVDTISMMVMTIPFLFPIAKEIGIDPIWFGIIVVKLVEIGAITPPVGLNLYAVLTAAEGRVTSRVLFRGVVPFIGFEAIALGLIWGFPEISLWLPRTMLK